MASSTSDSFINKFNSIEGITVGERKKYIFQLLNSHRHLKEDPNLDDILSQLKPSTYFEKKLYIDVLIYYKSYLKILHVFLSNDDALMKKIWKQQWFFDEIIKHFSSNAVVNDLIPSLSLVFRNRFLNKLGYCKDEIKLDEIYNLISQVYGPTVAFHMLHGCSLHKIEKVVDEYDVKMNYKILLYLLNNKKSYLIKFFEFSKDKFFDFYDGHRKLLHIIGGKDLHLLKQIIQNHNYSNLGKRLSYKICKLDPEFVITRAKDLENSLCIKSIGKALRFQNFKKYLFQILPKNKSELNYYRLSQKLVSFPKTKRLDILQEILEIKYHSSIIGTPNLISEELLYLISDINKREALLEILMKNNKDEYTLPQFYRIEKSIPELKKRLNLADGIYTRANLIGALIKTCKINNDEKKLLEVMEYICKRHRNDHEEIFLEFSCSLSNNFDLAKLSKEHWNFIHEITIIRKIKNRKFTDRLVHIKYIEYLYNNNEPINEEFQIFIKENFDMIVYWNLVKSNSELNKLLLINAIIMVPNIVLDTEKRTYIEFSLFEAILEWNKEQPNDKISYYDYPNILKSTIKQLKMYAADESHAFNSTMKNIFVQLLHKSTIQNHRFDQEIKLLAWNYLSKMSSNTIYLYFLRNEPLEIVRNFQQFVKPVIKMWNEDSIPIWNFFKLYDHLKLPHKTLQYVEKEGNNALILAILMNPNEYSKLILLPKNEKLDTTNENTTRELYHELRDLITYSKFSSNYLLPIVVELCKGDFLQIGLTALYYQFFHTMEKDLWQYILILRDRAVSVRKHSVKLACEVLSREKTFTLLKHFTETETNVSAREHLFYATFKYFLKNQTDDLWSLIQAQIKGLDHFVSEQFKKMCKLNSIPEKFRISHFNYMWDLLSHLEKDKKDVNDFREQLINSLQKDVSKLPNEFCASIIKDKFLSCTDFTILCIQHCQDKQAIFNAVFEAISDLKSEKWNHEDLREMCFVRSSLKSFISSLFDAFSSDDSDLNLISFINRWNEIFSPTDFFEEILKFNFLKIYINCKDVDKLFGEVEAFLNTICIEYQYNAINILADFILNVSNNFFSKIDISFAISLIGESSFTLKLLLIKLLPQELPTDDDDKKKVSKIIKELMADNNNLVGIELDNYLNRLNY